MSYTPPFFLFNGHLETIYPALFRKVDSALATEERITTPDDDFLDLFWHRQGSKKVVIISHGLEGNAFRAYIRGMGRACFLKGFDVLTWHFRGCGSEMNRQLRFYHSGATDDLHLVAKHAALKGYDEIYLIGFSLGGNMTLKYLGEQTVHPKIVKAVALSVPMDLHTSCLRISQPSNLIYSQRFLRSLKNKIISKSERIRTLDTKGINKIRTLIEFDDRYTAPLHGFRNALHYYESCSSLSFLQNIRIPVLIINARNDPFLSPECYPVDILKGHAFVRFESPVKGGHVGFAQFSKNGLYWSEERTVDFLTNTSEQHD